MVKKKKDKYNRVYFGGSVPSEWKNFQSKLLPSPRCDGCNRKCVVLYDRHHDEFFSLTCGLVIMEMGCYLLDYDVEYY